MSHFACGDMICPPPRKCSAPQTEAASSAQTRMAHSSYEYMFGKPALRFLLEDYMQV